MSQEYTGGCPLGRFEEYVSKDIRQPDICRECLFSNMKTKGFDLSKICQCPEGMTESKYQEYRCNYFSNGSGKRTKKGFQTYVRWMLESEKRKEKEKLEKETKLKK